MNWPFKSLFVLFASEVLPELLGRWFADAFAPPGHLEDEPASEPLVGAVAPVAEAFVKVEEGGAVGRVLVQGEAWDAEASSVAIGLEPGALVRIENVRGTRLYVSPVRDDRRVHEGPGPGERARDRGESPAGTSCP